MRGAKLYMNLTNEEEAIVTRLTENFWPGPFTILVKKSNYDKIFINKHKYNY